MQRAKDQEACGCDEIHGTQISYDDSKGEVIVIDGDDDEKVKKRPIGSSARPTGKMEEDNVAEEQSKKGKLEDPDAYDSKDRAERTGAAAEAETPCHASAKNKQSKDNFDIIDLTEADRKEGSPDLLEGLASEFLHPWTCKACTFINDSDRLNCEICSTPHT